MYVYYFAPGLRVDYNIAMDVMTWKCRCCVMRVVVFLVGSFFFCIISFRRRVEVSPARCHSFRERTKSIGNAMKYIILYALNQIKKQNKSEFTRNTYRQHALHYS